MQSRDLAQPLDRLRRPLLRDMPNRRPRPLLRDTPNRLRRPLLRDTPNWLRHPRRGITPDRFRLRLQPRTAPDRFPPRNLPRDLLLTIDQELDFTSAANISDLPFPCKMNC